jgi:hypothetical protein
VIPAAKEVWIAVDANGKPSGSTDGDEVSARATAKALNERVPQYGPYRVQKYVAAEHATATVASRCVVKRLDSDPPERGIFLGLMYEHEDVVAVVRLDGHGMFVTTVHPSRVELLSESTWL